MSPRDLEHQEIVKRILHLFFDHADSARVWRNTAYHMGDSQLQPDISYAWPDQSNDEHAFIGAPMIAIEVLSPGEESFSRICLYLRRGAKEVWIVNVRLRRFVIYCPGARIDIESEYRSAAGVTITPPDIFGAGHSKIGAMSRVLKEIYRLQDELTGIGWYDQMLLKMMANLLERHHGVAEPRNTLTFEEFLEIPGRWELIDGMLEG